MQHSRPHVVVAFGQVHLPLAQRLSGGQQRPAQHRSPSGQQACRWSFAQHVGRSSGQHDAAPLPAPLPGAGSVAQRLAPVAQHRLRLGDAQYSPSLQHAVPHFCSPSSQPPQTAASTRPGPHEPSGSGCEAAGLQGSQHDTSDGQPLEPLGPTEHVRSCGQHVGKQAPVSVVQYFQPSCATLRSHVCARATGTRPAIHTPATAAAMARSAPRRGIGVARVRARSSSERVGSERASFLRGVATG